MINFYKQLWIQLRINANIAYNVYYHHIDGIEIRIPIKEYNGPVQKARQYSSLSLSFISLSFIIVIHEPETLTLSNIINITDTSLSMPFNYNQKNILFKCSLANPKCFELFKEKIQQELNKITAYESQIYNLIDNSQL